MPDVSFGGLLIVVAVAFAAPLALGFFPRVRLPAVVLEIVSGIILGPSVLGWVKVDLPIRILSVLGLAFLLFLAGMEIELSRIIGRKVDMRTAEDLSPHFRQQVLDSAETLYVPR